MKTVFGLKSAALVACLSLVACGQEEVVKTEAAAKPVKAMIVGGEEADISRDFTGKVLASTTAELSFEVSGKLIELPIVEGSEKKKGQLLAKIDSIRYEQEVKDSEAKYTLAKAQYQRGKQLIVQKFISENEYDKLRSNMNIALASLNIAKRNLNDTILNAPFNGFVAKKYVDNFEYIKAKVPVLAFHDVEYMDVEIQLPEYIVLQVKTDMEVKAYVIFDQLGKEYELNFKEFSSKADPDTQTYRTVYQLKAPKGINVLPGMSVTVKLIIPDFKNNQRSFYLIPSSAVFSGSDNKPQVWVIEPKTNKVKAQTVTVANMSANNIKVLSGLNQGQKIVIAGVHFIRQGQKVTAMIAEKN